MSQPLSAERLYCIKHNRKQKNKMDKQKTVQVSDRQNYSAVKSNYDRIRNNDTE